MVCDTWYAVRTVEHVILQYLRPFGLEFGFERRIYMRQPATCALEPNALVPDRLRVKTGRPAHGRVLIHNLNGLLDGVVSGDWVLRRRPCGI